MCFDVFGADKIEQFNIQMGEELTVSFDVDARQWNDRWFNSIRAWKVERVSAGAPMASGSVPPPAPSAMPEFTPGDAKRRPICHSKPKVIRSTNKHKKLPIELNCTLFSCRGVFLQKNDYIANEVIFYSDLYLKTILGYTTPSAQVNWAKSIKLRKKSELRRKKSGTK